MKINIEFNWAFFTSIFTLFLYWCGYFYLSGMANYFHYNIDTFDIPLPTVILYGITYGFKEYMYFIGLIVIYSFFQHSLKNRFKYVYNKLAAVFLNFIIIFFRFKPISFILFCLLSPFIVLVKFFYKPKTKKLFKDITPRCIRRVYKCFLYENRRLKVETYLGLKNAKLSPIELKRIKNECPNSSNFDLVFLAHYLSLILLIFGFFLLFSFAQGLFDKGKQNAETQFQNSVLSYYSKKENTHNTYPRIELSNSKNNVLFSTEICFKGSCLITDLNRNVQLQEAKNIKFLGSSK
ncbi:hypothetical protein P256_00252 [Acinetobacter nectaris CIP 110549]|uniref:Uncharacterized protein n=1 Tax=Acinetobacter nectaris CIP 110549 TaxID=1392540 RepID=V2TGL9_9GAMM|nr:hypothetical protein [Acinetobacter nectaris]ESK41263.1 hypothetical protein P256_00252 [Acinetobacter nectaris CIP 110549]